MTATKEAAFQTQDEQYRDADNPSDVVYYDGKRRELQEEGLRFKHLAMGFGIGASVCAAATLAILAVDLKKRKDEKATLTASHKRIVIHF